VRRLATWVPPLLVGLFALPFILRQNSWWEWGNAYWLLERQSAHVSAHGVPTLFLHNFSGSYNPFFTFYAGFTLSVLAYPAALLGAWPVFAASVVAAIVAGYLGIWWTARNLGLSHQVAVLPALIFTTTPYVLSEMYGRGAWAELVAVNAVAVMLGGFTALIWRPGGRRAPALLALVAASAFIAGTHNLTLMMSAVLLPLTLLVLLPLRRPESPPFLPALARGVGAVALGIGLTAAWLLPNLWFGPSTLIAHPTSFRNVTFAQTFGVFTLSNLFSPLPRIPQEFDRWLYSQAPAAAAAWSLVAAGAIFWQRRRSWARTLATMAGLLAVGVGLVVLIVHPSWWLHFPDVVQTVQFPYRLIPYLAIVVALAAIAGLATLGARTGRWMTAALVAVVAVQTGAGVWIVVKSQPSAAVAVQLARHGDLPVATEPASFSIQGLVVQLQFRVVNQQTGKPPTKKAADVDIADPLTSDTGTIKGTGRVGDRMLVPIVWSRLVQVTGDARITGREVLGSSMITVTHTDAGGRWHANVRPAHPWQIVVGRLISALSALILLVAGLIGWRRHRRRRRPSQSLPTAGVPADPLPTVPA
jgi:hypothetical protein